MNIKRTAITLLLIALLSIPAIVYAHEEITVGDYKIKYGWKVEPPIAGDANAVTLDIVNSKDANAKVDITELKAEAVYGSESKVLTISPVFGQTNKFQALLTPTRAGQYTIRLSGKIGTTDVKAEVKPEEVDPADTVQFPSVPTRGGGGTGGNPANNFNNFNAFGLSGWLGVTGIVIGLIGVVLSILALRKKN